MATKLFTTPNIPRTQTKRQIGRRPNQKRQTRSSAPTHRSGMEAKHDIVFATPLFPATKRVKLFYYENSLSITAVAIAGNYFFTANGIFDVNITGTGHQPMGFDQMMLMYEQYTVVGSKISVSAQTGTSVAVRAGIYLSPDTTSITDPLRLMENGLITTKPVAGLGFAGYIKEFDLNCDVARYFGRNRNARALVDDVTLSGTVAANPTEQVYYAISAWDPFAASTWSLYFDVLLEYDVIFWEPRKLTVS